MRLLSAASPSSSRSKGPLNQAHRFSSEVIMSLRKVYYCFSLRKKNCCQRTGLAGAEWMLSEYRKHPGANAKGTMYG